MSVFLLGLHPKLKFIYWLKVIKFTVMVYSGKFFASDVAFESLNYSWRNVKDKSSHFLRTATSHETNFVRLVRLRLRTKYTKENPTFNDSANIT